MNYQKPKGTRDLLPADTRVWQFLEDTGRKIAGLYNYREIRTPTFEDVALYKRSVGDTSDIVSKEMYEFIDKGERHLALRPEGTAGVVRAVVENGMLNEALPQKLYYFSNCFRYENTQKGRYREFNQFGLECFGASNPEADAELIVLISNFLHALGIKDYNLLLNSIGCPECRAKYNEALREFASAHLDSLCGDCKRRANENPLRMLDCKVESCQNILKDAPSILDYLCDECRAHFEELRRLLNEQGVGFTVTPRLVRGLDYYTKTVFEFEHDGFDGKKLTIAAGGRYDNLVAEIGGKPCPALGVGIGLDRVVHLVDQSLAPNTPLYYIANTTEDVLPFVRELSKEYRNAGYSVETNLTARSFKAQMKYANAIGAKYLIVIGENEAKTREWQIKDLETGEILSSTANFKNL